MKAPIRAKSTNVSGNHKTMSVHIMRCTKIVVIYCVRKIIANNELDDHVGRNKLSVVKTVDLIITIRFTLNPHNY